LKVRGSTRGRGNFFQEVIHPSLYPPRLFKNFKKGYLKNSFTLLQVLEGKGEHEGERKLLSRSFLSPSYQ
jgi:hypothetical protein